MTGPFKKVTRSDRGWPKYLPGGRIRTSTVGMAIAFVAMFVIYQNYEPPAPTPETPAQVVPPGFVPDPAYTWVPRTYVQRPTPTTTETTPTETTSPTDTTSGTETTSGTATSGPLPTTVVDPDGPGPLPPTTITGSPTTTATAPILPLPNRSGTSTSTTTTVLPGAGPVSPTPLPPG